MDVDQKDSSCNMIWSSINKDQNKSSSKSNPKTISDDWMIRAPKPIRFPKKKFDVSEDKLKCQFQIDKEVSSFSQKKSFLSPVLNKNKQVEENFQSLYTRCSSAPLPEEKSSNVKTLPVMKRVRVRTSSVNIVSLNNISPCPGNVNSKHRISKLKLEESVSGMKFKETEHERKLQSNIQIECSLTSDCNVLSLTDETKSKNNVNILSNVNRTTLKAYKKLARSSDNVSCLNPSSSPASLGSTNLPSPLVGSSPTPLSPTRSMCCAVGRQLYSPSLNNRTPSPSPTKKFIKRRSQSPVVMRPSVLVTGGPKRKWNGESSEFTLSPKRLNFVPMASSANNSPTDVIKTCNNNCWPLHRVNQHRPSNLVHPTPMMVNEKSSTSTTSFKSHPLQFITKNHNSVDSVRSLSPASSTCSVSSLEPLATRIIDQKNSLYDGLNSSSMFRPLNRNYAFKFETKNDNGR